MNTPNPENNFSFKRLLTNLAFVEFLDYFGRFSTKKSGFISTKVYGPRIFGSKIGLKEPKNRLKPNPLTVSKSVKAPIYRQLLCGLNDKLFFSFGLSWIYWDPKPEAFILPVLNWPILWYGVLFALGFAISFPVLVSILSRFFSTYHRSESPKWRELAVSVADRLTIYVVLATVIGARLGHFLFYEEPARYLKDPIEILQIREGGLASHGAVVGIILALILFCRKAKIEGLNWVKLLDLIAIPTAFVGCCIRIGNFVNQEILGKPSDLPWAVLFGHPADWNVAMVPRHPVQIYEAVFYLAVFVLLWKLSYKSFYLLRNGKLIGIFLMLVFGFRFLIEFLKVEQSHLLS